MKLLFVTDSFPPKCGGAGWTTYHLVKALKEKGHKITVLKPNAKEKDFQGIEIHSARSIINEFNYIALRKKAKQLIKKYNIELCVATYLKSTLACAGLNFPFVTILHDYWPICYKGSRFNKKSKKSYSKSNYGTTLKCIYSETGLVIKVLSPLVAAYMTLRTKKALKALRKSCALFFNSNHVREIISPYVPKVPKYTIYNLIAKYPKEQIDENSEYAKEAKNSFVYAGKVNLYKGSELLEKIAAKMPNTNFIIVGSVEKEANLELFKNVTIVGYVNQKKGLGIMKNAKALIVTSEWEEPFGMIAAEALSLGTPVITSNRGGLKEIVEDGINGYVIEPNVDNFYKAINKLKDEKVRSKLAANTKNVFKKLDNDKLVRIFEEGAKRCLKLKKK